MTVSFGVEFEFDVVHRSGKIIGEVFRQGRICAPGWGFQDDQTAGVELRTPILTSIDQAVEEIARQFNFWVDTLTDYSPYPVNRGSRTLGQHLHIGKPTRPLKKREKVNLARAAANIYPLLAALQAQPVPSRRGLYSSYTSPIWEYSWDIPANDHFCEISNSHNGTVEFRIFDSNIPQISLVNAWILTEIAKKAFSENFSGIDIDRENYRKDRALALKFGLRALDIRRYLEYLRSITNDIRIPNYPFLREILYLAVKYRMNAFNIFHMCRPDPYKYFRIMFTNPDKFIENLFSSVGEFKNSTLSQVIKDTVNHSDDLEKLSDLIELSNESPRMLMLPSDTPYHSQNLPMRSHVAKKISLGEYEIRRISEVFNMDSIEVAERIEYLLKTHGEGFVNPVSAEEILYSPIRYYVFTVYNRVSNREDVLGAIGVNVTTGEITTLVVDRRYRRLGIAQILIDYVRGVCRQPLNGYVRADNVPMINLLKKLQFDIRPCDNRTIAFISVLREGRH